MSVKTQPQKTDMGFNYTSLFEKWNGVTILCTVHFWLTKRVHITI